MNTFKMLTDHLMGALNINLADVEQLVRWQEHAGLCKAGRFIGRDTFTQCYDGTRPAHNKALAALVEDTATAIANAAPLALIPPGGRVDFLLARINNGESPVETIRRTLNASLGELSLILGLNREATRLWCSENIWWAGDMDRDKLLRKFLVRLAPLLAAQIAVSPVVLNEGRCAA